MLELTSRVTRLPKEEGSAFMNLIGIPSTPVAFLFLRPFIIEMIVDSETLVRWNTEGASEQNDTGEIDVKGRASTSLSAIIIDKKWQFKSSGVKSKFTGEPDDCDLRREM